MNNLSENLIKLRKANGFKQEEIAEKVYVSRQAVSKWERGESSPDIQTLIALAQIYGVTLDNLILNAPIEANSNFQQVNDNFDELKKYRKSQLIKSMLVWIFLLFGVYALFCGILQVALYDFVYDIWLIWLTLLVVPPIIFALRFRHEIGKAWLMFFVNMPTITGILYVIIALYCTPYGSWLVFLIIPVYYLIATLVCVHYKKSH